MTEMRDAIIFVGFWRPQCPPSPNATILNYLNDRERRAPSSFVGFWRPPPPDVTILNYLTDREGGAAGIPFCRILAPPNAPPSPDSTMLNYLNDREGGAIIFCRILAPPPPLPQTPQYLTILMTGRKGAPISCKKLNIHV